MSFHRTALALVLAAAAAPAAFASSGATWVGGEAGFAEHAVTGQRTRAQVQQEFLEFRKNPVTHDGYDFIGGEIGYAPHRHKYVWSNGSKVHADGYTATMGNTGAAAAVQAAPLSEAEQRAYRQQYIN